MLYHKKVTKPSQIPKEETWATYKTPFTFYIFTHKVVINLKYIQQEKVNKIFSYYTFNENNTKWMVVVSQTPHNTHPP